MSNHQFHCQKEEAEMEEEAEKAEEVITRGTSEKKKKEAAAKQATNSVTMSTKTCDCPKRCKAFQLLPLNEGIMITLRHHHQYQKNQQQGQRQQQQHDIPSNYVEDAADAQKSSSLSFALSGTTQLEIIPQTDANLSMFHPNIYIPAVMLDYPDELIKYGGGGEKGRQFIHREMPMPHSPRFHQYVLFDNLNHLALFFTLYHTLHTLHTDVRLWRDSLRRLSSPPWLFGNETWRTLGSN